MRTSPFITQTIKKTCTQGKDSINLIISNASLGTFFLLQVCGGEEYNDFKDSSVPLT